MLQFFGLPFGIEPGRHFGIVVEEAAQVTCIEICTAFDKRSRAQQQQQILVGDGAWMIDSAHVDVFDSPGHCMDRFSLHVWCSLNWIVSLNEACPNRERDDR